MLAPMPLLRSLVSWVRRGATKMPPLRGCCDGLAEPDDAQTSSSQWERRALLSKGRLLHLTSNQMMHPHHPPDIAAYVMIVSACVATMLLVHRFVRYPFASCLGCMLAFVPVVISVWYKLRFADVLTIAGYTGITPLEVIHHRHHVSFLFGIISSGTLLFAVATRSVCMSYRRFPPTATLPIAALLILTGCAHPRHSYKPTDEFFGSGHFDVPSEFQRGTASLSDIEAWSYSLLGKNPLELRRIDINGDRLGELFVSQPSHRGTGGNSYLVFGETRRGFHYLGRLFFGGLRPLTRDHHNRPRVLTTSWMGGGECNVAIQVLQSDGFHDAASRVLPCGDSATDGEGGLLHKRLFESDAPHLDALRTVFGRDFL